MWPAFLRWRGPADFNYAHGIISARYAVDTCVIGHAKAGVRWQRSRLTVAGEEWWLGEGYCRHIIGAS